MWCIVVFVAITLSLAQAATVEDVKKCMDLKQPTTWKCCKPESPRNPKKEAPDSTREAAYRECAKLPTENCERENCFGVKEGFLTPDGKLDKKATQEKFTNDFSSVITSEHMDKIVKNCIVGDLAIYGQPDACDFQKFGQCVDLLMIMNCPNWSTESSCEDTRKLADECSKLFA